MDYYAAQGGAYGTWRSERLGNEQPTSSTLDKRTGRCSAQRVKAVNSMYSFHLVVLLQLGQDCTTLGIAGQ